MILLGLVISQLILTGSGGFVIVYSMYVIMIQQCNVTKLLY